MDKVVCVILAAGLGKRMGADLPKVAIKTREKALLEHVLDSSAEVNPEKTIVITGYKNEVVEELVKNSPSGARHAKVVFALQDKQLGTGHAVKCALPEFSDHKGTVLILYGDAPLIRSESIRLLLEHHRERNATLSLLSFEANYPHPYGRIVRSKRDGEVEKIVEAKDCNSAQKLIKESNSGIYAVESAFLRPAVNELTNDNAQKEFYLTDIVLRAAKEGQRIEAICLHDSNEALGVNTPIELSVVNRELEKRQIALLKASGVTVISEDSLFIDSNVKVAPGVILGPNVQLRGSTIVEKDSVVEGSAVIVNSTIAEGAVIKFCCRVEGSTIGRKAAVGPFAHIRPGTILGEEAKVGNFVETKNAKLSDHVKASHLTYLGDCEIGRDTNIGAGTITCNYDGKNKNKTTIGEGVFIGSDSCLIAPVDIGNGAYVGAGSVISKKVPAEALAFTRPPLVIKEGWSRTRKK